MCVHVLVQTGESILLFVSSRRRHTRCALVTGVQTCALPIYGDFDVPPYATVGLAWTATPALTAAFDFQRIAYSRVRALGNDFYAQIGRAPCRERVCPYV